MKNCILSVQSLMITLFLLALITAGVSAAENSVVEELGNKAGLTAMNLLHFDKGAENILALTNAGHAFVDGKTTERAIEGITQATGLNNGKANLFQINRPDSESLWFYFYDKNSGMALYLEPETAVFSMSADELAALPADQAFSRVSSADVKLDKMLANPSDGNTTFNEKVFNGKEFSLIGISNIWAEPNATYDFLTAASFHDHLCPGVTSGYMIAKYVEKKLPLKSATQKYIDIACPNWCKEDAMQMIWDATPGKSTMFVMALDPNETADLQKKYKTGVAGFVVRYDDKTKNGTALALGFDWDKVYNLTGTADWKGPSWGSKLVMDIEMMKYWNNPEVAVSTIKEIPVNESILTAMKTAGNDPYQVTGLI